MKQTLAWGTAGVAAAAVAAVVLTAGAAPAEPGPRNTAGAVARQVVQAAPAGIDAGNPALRFGQAGATVSAALDGKDVASVKLKAATFKGSSARIVLTVTALRPFTLAPDRFTLGDADGNENSPTNQRVERIGVGTRDIVLDFEDIGPPEALLWVPQDEAADPDDSGVAGNWVLPPTLDAGETALQYTQKGETVRAALDGTTVASVSLKSWRWSGTAGKVVLTVTTTRPFTIDPMMFNLAADDSNENSPTNEELVRVGAGTHDVTLDFEGFRSPGALLWTPQEAKSDDDGIAGDWTLSPR
jgi:hypothetical protein